MSNSSLSSPLPVRTASAPIRHRLPAAPALILSLWLLLALLTPHGVLAATDPVHKQYQLARAAYHNLLLNDRRPAGRDRWQWAARSFRRVVSRAPRHAKAPAALYMAGLIYHRMYRLEANPLDLGESVAAYEELAQKYPATPLADDALLALGHIYRDDKHDPQRAARTFARLVAVCPNGDMAPEAARQLALIKGRRTAPQRPSGSAAAVSLTELAKIEPIRFWSNNDYTRIVIEASSPVTFKQCILPRDGDLPRRLYIDLNGAWIPADRQKPLPIEDGLLRQVRTAQFTPDTVRVVLDIQSISDHQVFSLQDPFRVVIDVKGEQTAPTVPEKPTLAQQLGLGIRRIVLDPGHGGKDPGAIGPFGLKEKDIVLKVAKETAAILRDRLGCEVILTRDRDVFVPLEERTAIANTRGADLFVSIHVNAAPTKNVRGIETYFLDLATNNDAMQVAARENATSTRQLSDLQTILMDLIQNTKLTESARLASFIQDTLVRGLSGQYRDVNNLGVKQAPFVVLIGAQMPAILTEIAFVSNPVEAKRLKSELYLGSVAENLVNGISQYVSNLTLASSRDLSR